MSTIDIKAHHELGREEAILAADELSADLAEKFAISYRREGDTIHFERPGVTGRIVVEDGMLTIHARLGIMLMILKEPIEAETRRYLEDRFGCRFDD